MVRGPPVGRHLAAFGLTVGLLWYFWWLHGQAIRSGNPGLSNRVFADASVALLCLILILAPMARFVPRVRRFVPWGRELGIAMFVTASVHVVMVLPHLVENVWTGWVDHMLGSFRGEGVIEAANAVGWLAFVVSLVLAVISNDVSHRLLGRGWKFAQRQAYTLFVLTVLHSVPWLEWMNADYVIATEWFWWLAALVVLLQFTGFWHTVLGTRGPSPRRAPARRRFEWEGVWVGATKWLVVGVLWGGMFLYPTLDLGSGSDLSEGDLAALCATYDEAGIEGLAEALPEDVRSGSAVEDREFAREFAEECEGLD
jgi:DMSO/TMAO reductase YedYZ heme-binding membrane subunit